MHEFSNIAKILYKHLCFEKPIPPNHASSVNCPIWEAIYFVSDRPFGSKLGRIGIIEVLYYFVSDRPFGSKLGRIGIIEVLYQT